MERLMSPLKRGTKDYLSAAVVPTLIEGLTNLSIVRPPDPHVFLAKFLLERSPNKSDYVLMTVAEAKTAFASTSSPPAAGSAISAIRSLTPRADEAKTAAAEAAERAAALEREHLAQAEEAAVAKRKAAARAAENEKADAMAAAATAAAATEEAAMKLEQERLAAAALKVAAAEAAAAQSERLAAEEAAALEVINANRPAFQRGVKIGSRYLYVRLRLDEEGGSFTVYAYEPSSCQTLHLAARGLNVAKLREEKGSDREVGAEIASHLGLQANDNGTLVLFLRAPGNGG